MKRKGFLIIALLIAFGIFFVGCNEEVTPSLSLTTTSFTTTVGETATIVPEVIGVEGLTLEYATDNAAVATVAAGVVTAVSAGTAKITISLTDYPEVKVEATVIVKAKAPITLNFSETAVTVTAGDEVTVTPKLGGTAEALTLVYASSNAAVATVAAEVIDSVATGVITAVAAGQAIITVSVQDQPTIEAKVTVTVIPVVTLDDFAPNNIIVMGQDSMYVGEPVAFPTNITAPAAYKGLYWTTSDPTVAIVDGLGLVTPLKSGTVTITATSALDPDIFGVQVVDVFERGTDLEIGMRALNYIKANMPEYVGADFDLPVYANDKIMVTWTKADATAITDGIFNYDETITADAQTVLTCKVEYVDFMVEEVLTLKLVLDVNDNAFKSNELVKNYLDAYFYNYLKATDPSKVTADLSLLTSLKGTTIAWATNDATKLTKDGVYTRPNDDTVVTLSATVTTGAVGIPLSYALNVKGYSMEEKIAYILAEGDLAPLVNKTSNCSIVLPTVDSKFNLDMAWASDVATVFDNTGKFVTRDLAANTAVVYTVTFTDHGFDPAVVGTTTVNVTALAATDTSKAVFDFVADPALIGTVPSYFPFGVATRVGGNTITGLPASVATAPGVTIEWAGNTEDFDGVTLKTQYLRYHESLLTATFKKTGVTDSVISFVVKTGIAEDPDALYIGGRFSEQKSAVADYKYDLLNTFSYWDTMVGSTTYTGQQFWSYYSGYTIYINADTDGATTFTANPDGRRYQYFPMDYMTVYITAVSASGVPTYEYANLREKTGGNWAVFFVNLTASPAKVPFATYGSGNDVDGVPLTSKGTSEQSLGYDGYRKGFTASADGTVVIGSEFGVIQSKMKEADTTITIPANGYGMTYKTQENQPIMGVFCQTGAKLTIEKYNLAPQNDFRYNFYNNNIAAAKTKMDNYEAAKADQAVEELAVFPSGRGTKTPEEIAAAIAAYYSGLLTGVDTNLKAAETYRNYDKPMLTPLADLPFDDASFTAQATRSAAFWDVRIAALKLQQADADYLQKLLVVYRAYDPIAQGVKDLIVDHAWLQSEYDTKLSVALNIDLVLNGGSIYTQTRAQVATLFLTDLYAHLQAKGFVGLPATFAEFSNATYLGTWFTDANMRTYVFELYKDNVADTTPNLEALTVDTTGTATQLIRQAAYNAKWLPLLYWINDTIQIGHNGGRDLLGRFGLPYEFHYFPASSYTGTVSDPAGSTTRFKEYMLGTYAYGTYRNLFLVNTWTLDATTSQTYVDGLTLTYTGGDAAVTVLTVVKTGFTFGGWYLDAALTNKPAMTPVGLGIVDVVLYAKWNPVA